MAATLDGHPGASAKSDFVLRGALKGMKGESRRRIEVTLATERRIQARADIAIALSNWLLQIKARTEVTKETAVAILAVQAAEQSPVALRRLALAYERGCGVSGDLKRAHGYMLHAANLGDATSQRYLAGMYINGRGCPENEDAAFRWYRRAFDQGDLKAQLALADCYDEGVGCLRDAEEARRHRVAALMGESLASKTKYG
ncbi:hypothetical protein M885DRAFT_458497 [Pelagophyceae sp. CCMP2097]|nr:hypothetical protein M885DRAFT_458497 [Pelagophyceae sp. CCMP2097]